MLGDVLLITEKHIKAADQIISELEDIHKLNKFSISIGGESGSGKTEISHLVAKNFKKRGVLAKTIHTDNFYKTLPKERSEWRRKENYNNVGLNEIDWEALNSVFQTFRDGNVCSMPVVDLLTDQVDTLITDFSDINIIIFDGLYSLKMNTDLRFMIDLTYKETKLAQTIRGKETMDEIRLKVLMKEHESVQSLKPTADYFITRNFDIKKVRK